ncbi:MAG: wax ester/triacylglycerol synthase family O-acyltransferase [Actinomycetota bacterium]
MAGDARYLSQNDTVMWMMESDPLLRSTILGVVVLDRPPEWGALAERVERVTHHVPTLRQKVVSPPLHPKTLRWVADPEFDLHYHLRRVSLPAPGRFGDLLDLARTSALGGFDRARPLWEFTLVEGLEDGGAALVMKAHHVLTDGIGSVQLAAHLFDFEPLDPDGGSAPPPDTGERPLDPMELLRDVVEHEVGDVVDFARRNARSALPALVRAVRHPQEAIHETVETVRSLGRLVEPVDERLSPVMTDRKMFSEFNVVEVPLDELRRAAKAVGGTINDGFLAGVTGGLRRYHERHGAEVGDLRVAMPLSVRTDDDAEGGNHVTVLRFKVPVGVAEPAERVAALHAATSEVRAERSIGYIEAVSGLLSWMPQGVIGSMLKKVDFLASNVPGVTVPMYLVGSEVRRFFPFGPTAGSAVNATLMSYRDWACIGLNTDAAAIPDPEVFTECVDEGFAEVLALADG